MTKQKCDANQAKGIQGFKKTYAAAAKENKRK